MTLGERLRAERLKKGVTELELAKAVGVTQAAISYFESGIKIPSTAVIANISNYFNVTIDYLIKGD